MISFPLTLLLLLLLEGHVCPREDKVEKEKTKDKGKDTKDKDKDKDKKKKKDKDKEKEKHKQEDYTKEHKDLKRKRKESDKSPFASKEARKILSSLKPTLGKRKAEVRQRLRARVLFIAL